MARTNAENKTGGNVAAALTDANLQQLLIDLAAAVADVQRLPIKSLSRIAQILLPAFVLTGCGKNTEAYYGVAFVLAVFVFVVFGPGLLDQDTEDPPRR